MPRTVLKRDTYDMSACREGGGGGGDRSGRHRVGAAAAGSAAEGKAVAAEALPAVLAVLQACVSGSTRPLADPVASGFYFTLLKTLRLLVPEASIWCHRKGFQSMPGGWTPACLRCAGAPGVRSAPKQCIPEPCTTSCVLCVTVANNFTCRLCSRSTWTRSWPACASFSITACRPLARGRVSPSGCRRQRARCSAARPAAPTGRRSAGRPA